MARRHQRGVGIDRALERLERHRDAVGRFEHHHVDVLRQPLIWQRREIEPGRDDSPPLAGVETAADHAEDAGHRGVQRDFAGLGMQQSSVAVPQLLERGPPDVIPVCRAAIVPLVQACGDPPARLAGKSAERARIEVDVVLEDRELGAPVGERIHDRIGRHGEHARKYRANREMTSHPSPSTFLSVNAPADPGTLPGYRGSWPALMLQLSARAVVSPRLAIDLLRTAWAFRRREWWRTGPVSSGSRPATYLRWRMYTAYGDEHAVPPIEDVMRFARWRRTTMRV